jgi:hypothetical protein
MCNKMGPIPTVRPPSFAIHVSLPQKVLRFDFSPFFAKCACSMPRSFLLDKRVGITKWPGVWFNPSWKALVRIGGFLSSQYIPLLFPICPRQWIPHSLLGNNFNFFPFFWDSESMGVWNQSLFLHSRNKKHYTEHFNGIYIAWIMQALSCCSNWSNVRWLPRNKI